MGMKTTKTTWFFNQNENKGRPNSKFKTWNKKKQGIRTQVQTKIQQDFITKNKHNNVMTRKCIQNQCWMD